MVQHPGNSPTLIVKSARLPPLALSENNPRQNCQRLGQSPALPYLPIQQNTFCDLLACIRNIATSESELRGKGMYIRYALFLAQFIVERLPLVKQGTQC